MKAKDISDYLFDHRDELVRLFRNRYACFIPDGKGGVKVDACYNSFFEGVSGADERYGRGNYLLRKIVPLSEEEISIVPEYV